MSKEIQAQTKYRAPVVAVLGHVDHGKTSLLDAIRGTNVQSREKGGITQNTRAHKVTTKNGTITFIDTPGHEAFSNMRARGAAATDFVMLVVAADDGVQPQTKESIKFSKESLDPVIVAINKIDLPGVKVEKVKQELASFDILSEDYGGDIMMFPVSALKKQGLDELLEGIELLAEISELKPHELKYKEAYAQSYVLESTLDKRLGAVALCILKGGEITDKAYGVTKDEIFKVRALLDDNQKQTSKVIESDPFWVTGLKKPLHTGDQLYFTYSEDSAKVLQALLVEEIKQIEKAKEASSMNKQLMQMLMQKKALEMGVEKKELNVILKTSTEGTLEAVKEQITKLGNDEKSIRVLDAGAGPVTEDDIRRAQAANGIVISFQQAPSNAVDKFAKQNSVVVRNYEIIYEMLDELSGALEGLLEPKEEEIEVARAKVKQIFKLSNGSIVAGCKVIMGNIVKGYQVYVERPTESSKDEIAEVGRAKISALKVLKQEVKEVKKGMECGIMLNPQVETIMEGDEIVAYKIEKH